MARPVICLETKERFGSLSDAGRKFDAAVTNISHAIKTGGFCNGYHFYYADTPKPPDSHFKRAVHCESLNTTYTTLEAAADAIGFNGSAADFAARIECNEPINGYRFSYVGIDRKPARDSEIDAHLKSNLASFREEKPGAYTRFQELLGIICEYENAVQRPEEERVTHVCADGIVLPRKPLTARELKSLSVCYEEYLNFADEVEDFTPFVDDGTFDTRGKYLRVSSAAEIFCRAGLPRVPFFYTYGHLRDALTKKHTFSSLVKHPHGLTATQIKRLPELLSHPVVLMDSDYPDKMVAVLNAVDNEGLPLIAAIRPNGTAVMGNRACHGNIVLSVYGKPEMFFVKKMLEMPERVIYQNIEKGRELDARAKLQLFGGHIVAPDLVGKIIRPPECVVNLKLAGQRASAKERVPMGKAQDSYQVSGEAIDSSKASVRLDNETKKTPLPVRETTRDDSD